MKSTSRSKALYAVGLLAFFVAGFYVARAAAQPQKKEIGPQVPPLRVKVDSPDPLEAGKYLVLVGACNDCHTPNFMTKGLEVPESEWLVGVPIGWHGPWGTTYASNLRRYVKAFTEDDFVAEMHDRKDSPPMPWASMHAMPEQDLRAMYKYIKSLKPLGKQTPASVDDPKEEPKTEYYELVPVKPKKGATTKPAAAQ